MKTIEISEFGNPEVLHIGTRERPTPKENEVLVRVFAAGVNGPDMMQRRGLYPPPPGASDLMGLEVSGEITQIGDGVKGWKVGDVICALTNGGGYAEYVSIDARHCLPIPKNVDVIDAAGLCETFFTVWSNLFFNQSISTGSTLLIHGGSGGIGSTAIQLGSQLGMRVFATCSNPTKAEFCLQNGAEIAINYKEQDFVEIVKENGGADIILDIVGADYIERNFKAANQDGKIVQLAFRKGSKVEINLMPIMLKRLTLTGSTLRPRTPEFKAEIAKQLLDVVWPMFEAGKLQTHTHAKIAFKDIINAHQMMEDATHIGKIILTMDR